MGGPCADSDQQGSGSQQQEYDGQQLSTHQSYHAGSGAHAHMTPEGLAAALQMASDQALGLAAHMDGADTLGQVPASVTSTSPDSLSPLRPCRQQ